MSELHKHLTKILGLNDDEGEDAVVRRIISLKESQERSLERATRWEMRFKALAELAGDEAVERAKTAAISDEKMKLLDWLDPTGSDFLGTGLSMREYFLSDGIERHRRSFCSQMRDEKDRRLDLIIRLAVEYRRICDQDRFGTAALTGAMHDIILGEKADAFDERVRWMLDHKLDYPGCSDEEREIWRERFADRDELWRPAIWICREYTDAFRPVPDDRPVHPDWETMVTSEPGLVELGAELDLDFPGRVFAYEQHLYAWRADPHQQGHLCVNESVISELFEAGVRWHGPDDQHGGFWYMADGDPFPDDPDKYCGNRYHRIFGLDMLFRWLGRKQKRT